MGSRKDEWALPANRSNNAAMSQAHSVPSVPWSERILDDSPLSPFWAGVLLALGFLLVFFAFELLLGRLAEFEVDTYREDLRVAVVLSLIAAYLPAAWLGSVRSARRTADELMPSLTRGDGTLSIAEAGGFERNGLRKAGMVGVAVLVVVFVFVESTVVNAAALEQMSPEAYFHRVLAIWIGWFAGRSAYATWVESKRFEQDGRERLDIDLLDLTSVAPLTRFGLRQALITIGAFSLLALLFYDSQAAPNLIWFLLAISLPFLLLAAAALFLPVRGVHDAIVREKANELARVNDQIRRARAGSSGHPSLADWIAYRGLVESVRDWPVDAPTLRRFALYLAIPLGSWLGGALMERMVDTFLG